MALSDKAVMEPALAGDLPCTRLLARSRRRRQLAVSVHFSAWPDWRDAFRVVLRRARHVTRVGISAGSPDCTFYRSAHDRGSWSDAQRVQSGDMLEAAVDELGEREICTTAVLDLFAPRYLEKQPQFAAVDMRGRRSTEIVCSTALAEGEYGRIVDDAFEALATSTGADSLAIANLRFGWHCFCERCLARFESSVYRNDWPRLQNGAVDLLNPALGHWRSGQVARTMSGLSRTAHAEGKRMLLEVELSSDDFSRNGRENGHDYALLRPCVDEFVVRDPLALNDMEPAESTAAARYLWREIGPDDYWHCVALSSGDGLILEARRLRRSLQSALRGGARRLWIAPSHLLSPLHWQQIDESMSRDDVAGLSAG